MATDTVTGFATNAVTGFGGIATTVLTSVLGLAVLLIGGGYAWSQFRRKVYGKKI